MRALRDEVAALHAGGKLQLSKLAGGRTGGMLTYTHTAVRGDHVAWFDGEEAAGTWPQRTLSKYLQKVDTLVAQLATRAGGHLSSIASRSKAMGATLRRLLGARDPHRAVLERWVLEQEGRGRTPPGLRPGSSSSSPSQPQSLSPSKANGHATDGGDDGRNRGGSFQLSAAEISNPPLQPCTAPALRWPHGRDWLPVQVLSRPKPHLRRQDLHR